MSAISQSVREPDNPDIATGAHLSATFPLMPDASDKIVAEGMAMIDLLRKLERRIQRMLIAAPRRAQSVAGTGDPFAEQSAAPPTLAVVSAPAATGPSSTAAYDELRRFVERQLRHSVPGAVFKTLMCALERLLLEEGIRLAEGNQSKACRMLGLSRPAFRDKLAKHRLLKQYESPPPRKPR